MFLMNCFLILWFNHFGWIVKFELSSFNSTANLIAKRGRAAKVKDGIISETKFLGTFLVDRYNMTLYL
jgi:hypothetical protein